MEIEYQYRTDEVTNGATLYANGVYVGDLLDVSQGEWVNWCAIQGEFKCKFALRNEDTFDRILCEIKRYASEKQFSGVVISSYSSGGIRSFFSDEFWIKKGFMRDENAPGEILFLNVD